nr:MFS transporter [Chloroflexia bacterium]
MATAPLAAALIGVFIGALDLTVIATILPSMVMGLNVNTADVDRYVWIVNGYLLAYIVAIPLMGRVSDIIGRRPAFLIALTVFVVGSAWCASAGSLSSLIAARVVQGAGGGAVLPVTMALVGDLAAPAKRVAALGVVGAVDTLGWVVGPIWGAAIVGVLGGDKDSWRWVFWINLPLGVLAASAIMIGIAPRPTSKSQSLDVVGALLLAIALVALNLALSSGGELSGNEGSGLRALGGTRNPLADHLVELLLLTVVAAGLFMLWERRNSAPLVPLALFRHCPFVIAMATNFLVGAALIIAMVDVPIVI